MHQAELATRRWVEDFVVALELCPFARREVENKRLRYAVSGAANAESLLQDLADELQHLLQNDGTETTLLVHPQVLQDFDEYNDFLDYVDALLQQMNLWSNWKPTKFLLKCHLPAPVFWQKSQFRKARLWK